MPSTITNLQRGILPNIFILRKLIQWFDAVSGALDTAPTLVAAALVDAGATYFQKIGFATPIAHPSAGVYTLPFSGTVDTTKTVAEVTLTAITGPVTVSYFCEVDFPDTAHVRVQIFKDTAGVVSAQDNSFFITVWQLPI